jgi:hypothetical protein
VNFEIYFKCILEYNGAEETIKEWKIKGKKKRTKGRAREGRSKGREKGEKEERNRKSIVNHDFTTIFKMIMKKSHIYVVFSYFIYCIYFFSCL